MIQSCSIHSKTVFQLQFLRHEGCIKSAVCSFINWNLCLPPQRLLFSSQCQPALLQSSGRSVLLCFLSGLLFWYLFFFLSVDVVWLPPTGSCTYCFPASSWGARHTGRWWPSPGPACSRCFGCLSSDLRHTQTLTLKSWKLHTHKKYNAMWLACFLDTHSCSATFPQCQSIPSRLRRAEPCPRVYSETPKRHHHCTETSANDSKYVRDTPIIPKFTEGALLEMCNWDQTAILFPLGVHFAMPSIHSMTVHHMLTLVSGTSPFNPATKTVSLSTYVIQTIKAPFFTFVFTSDILMLSCRSHWHLISWAKPCEVLSWMNFFNFLKVTNTELFVPFCQFQTHFILYKKDMCW